MLSPGKVSLVGRAHSQTSICPQAAARATILLICVVIFPSLQCRSYFGVVLVLLGLLTHCQACDTRMGWLDGLQPTAHRADLQSTCMWEVQYWQDLHGSSGAGTSSTGALAGQAGGGSSAKVQGGGFATSKQVVSKGQCYSCSYRWLCV